MAERGLLDGVFKALGLPQDGEPGVTWKPRGARGMVGDRFKEEEFYNQLAGVGQRSSATADVKTEPQNGKKTN